MAAAMVVKLLPRVTCHNVEVRLDSCEILAVVDVEIKESVALELVPVVERACAVLTDLLGVAVAPSHDGVGSDFSLRLVLAHLIAEVEVEVEFGEEVESVVDLEVTGR